MIEILKWTKWIVPCRFKGEMYALFSLWGLFYVQTVGKIVTQIFRKIDILLIPTWIFYYSTNIIVIIEQQCWSNFKNILHNAYNIFIKRFYNCPNTLASNCTRNENVSDFVRGFEMSVKFFLHPHLSLKPMHNMHVDIPRLRITQNPRSVMTFTNQITGDRNETHRCSRSGSQAWVPTRVGRVVGWDRFARVFVKRVLHARPPTRVILGDGRRVRTIRGAYRWLADG